MDNILAPLVIEAVKDADWQRKITARCDALSPSYPVSNISLDKKLYGGVIIEGKQYLCELQATGLKDSGKDKDKTWSWWWKIVKWDVDESDSGADIPWGQTTSATAPATTSNASPKVVFDATAGQRYTQFGLNVRTALMQAVGILTVNGEYLGTDEGLKTTSDMILEYLNARVFAESPLVVNAIEAGAVPVAVPKWDAVEEKPDVNELLFTGTVEEIKPDEWFRPPSIADGKEFKAAATTNGFELDWIMQKFQELGISKSADYVNGERGSYLDLLNLLIHTAEIENVKKGLQDLEEI